MRFLLSQLTKGQLHRENESKFTVEYIILIHTFISLFTLLYHIVSLDITFAVCNVRWLAEIPRDGLADCANVGEVPVGWLVRVVDSAKRF